MLWGIMNAVLVHGQQRDFSYNVHGVVHYSVLLALHGTAKEKWWQVRANITGATVFLIPPSTSVA